LPKLPTLNAKEAEKLLLKHGFALVRIKGSHHIYKKENKLIVIPFHSGQSLHPKIIKSVFELIES